MLSTNIFSAKKLLDGKKSGLTNTDFDMKRQANPKIVLPRRIPVPLFAENEDNLSAKWCPFDLRSCAKSSGRVSLRGRHLEHLPVCELRFCMAGTDQNPAGRSERRYARRPQVWRCKSALTRRPSSACRGGVLLQTKPRQTSPLRLTVVSLVSGMSFDHPQDFKGSADLLKRKAHGADPLLRTVSWNDRTPRLFPADMSPGDPSW